MTVIAVITKRNKKGHMQNQGSRGGGEGRGGEREVKPAVRIIPGQNRVTFLLSVFSIFFL